MIREFSLSRLKTSFRWCMWFSGEELATRMSSRYVNTNGRSSNTWSIIRWKVCPAFRRPKGMRRNSHKPKGVVMAVLGMSVSARGIRWYPRTRSIFVKIVLPASLADTSDMFGIGYLSGTVAAFKRR